jgi:hypothetical protein
VGGATAAGGSGGGAVVAVIAGRFGQPARSRVSEMIGSSVATVRTCLFMVQFSW